MSRVPISPGIRKYLFLPLVALLVSQALCAQAQSMDARRAAYEGPQPKYVFFFIGDGLGFAQAGAAEAFQAALQGRTDIVPLEMNRLPEQGVITTYAQNRFITDSAAAGTTLATGIKTTVNTIGMDGARKNALRNVAEAARDMGMKVGILTTMSIDHATPATFYAHQPDRDMYYEIALQLSESGFDYFGGGGFCKPNGEHDAPSCIDVARRRGYRIVNTRDDILKLAPGAGKVIAVSPRLTGGECVPYAIDQRPDDLTLEDFTRKGIEFLDNPNGFFMMIEGGKMDWACHANDAATTVREVLDMDKAVNAAIDFYNAHPGETLIVVTSDHETGGMSLGYAGTHYESDIGLLANQKASYEAFTDIVKQYRKEHPGGGSEMDALALVKKYFGLGDASKNLALTADEEADLRAAFKAREPSDADGKARFYLLYGDKEPLAVAACRILAHRAGIAWASFVHTASPVPIRAVGPGSELFTGYIDNADVAKNIFLLLEKREAAK